MKHLSYLAVVLMLNYTGQGKKNGLFWCNPRDLGTMVTLKPIMHHDLKDPATGCIKVRGEGSVIRPKALGGDVAEKSLVGRPCNRILEKLGKTGCPLSPFSLPCKHNLRFGLVTAAIKTAFFSDVKTSPGPLKYFL